MARRKRCPPRYRFRRPRGCPDHCPGARAGHRSGPAPQRLRSTPRRRLVEDDEQYVEALFLARGNKLKLIVAGQLTLERVIRLAVLEGDSDADVGVLEVVVALEAGVDHRDARR